MSSEAENEARLAGGLGPGTVVLIVGPSGAGKDALLQGASESLHGDPRFRFPPRLINRPADGNEQNHQLDVRSVTDVQASPHYALWWTAHGLIYALSTGLDEDVRQGRCVVFNASRTIVARARDRYRSLRVVYIDAPLEVRASRIAARGRESAAEAEARLARDVAGFAPNDADDIVMNDGSLQSGITRLKTLLLRYADQSD
ncbi:MAG: phosphonate metabolism protein/1,5-bisphosphokinase (PRPP-forming) PhnN [Pseudomonadota bacterium]